MKQRVILKAEKHRDTYEVDSTCKWIFVTHDLLSITICSSRKSIRLQNSNNKINEDNLKKP